MNLLIYKENILEKIFNLCNIDLSEKLFNNCNYNHNIITIITIIIIINNKRIDNHRSDESQQTQSSPIPTNIRDRGATMQLQT